MKPSQRRHSGHAALDLVEQAVHLLRTAPVTALAQFYVGSLPFVLGVLYFWADMSRSPFARQRVVESALGVGALFVWMKFWQALFARRLRAHAAGEVPERMSVKQCFNILFTQAALQPTGLFLLPLASIVVLPVPPVYAFYQNLTVLGRAGDAGVRGLLGAAARHAALWPRQNVLAFAQLSAFGFFVWFNCVIVCAVLPLLLKSLLGIETAFSRGGTAMLNTTFFATMIGVAYLCVDPIFKAVYVLRCFYGDAIRSGADLRVEIRRTMPESERAI